MAITIRPAESSDLAAIGEVHTRARCHAYRDFVPAQALEAVGAGALTEWWTERWAYERDTHRLTVAQDHAGAVVGFTYVGPGPRPGTGELYAIHVDPGRQGDGIGQALMASALTTLVDLGESGAVLWVLADNAAARRFYERGGWHGDGVEREAPIGSTLTRQLRYSRDLPAG